MNAALAEAWLALAGTLRLVRADPRGVACFDASERGFWHSFRAAALCFPLYLILLAFPIEIGSGGEIDAGRFYAVEMIRFVISWTAFPLVVLPIVDRLGRGDRFFLFITVYNWSQVPQHALFAAIALLKGLGVMSVDAVVTFDLIASIGVLLFEWYIARLTLGTSARAAALIIAVDVALASALTLVSLALY
jgi:hypothetical protein